MTKQERATLRRAITLIRSDDADNSSRYERGMEILFRLAELESPYQRLTGLKAVDPSTLPKVNTTFKAPTLKGKR